MIAVNPLVAPGQRRIVGEADKLDDNILLVAKIFEALAHAIDEIIADINALVAVQKRCDQVLHAGAARMSVDITKFADRLHTANLHLLNLVRHEEFFQRDTLDDFVVPDFDVYAPVLRPALCRVVRCDWPCIACPFKRDRLGRQDE